LLAVLQLKDRARQIPFALNWHVGLLEMHAYVPECIEVHQHVGGVE